MFPSQANLRVLYAMGAHRAHRTTTTTAAMLRYTWYSDGTYPERTNSIANVAARTTATVMAIPTRETRGWTISFPVHSNSGSSSWRRGKATFLDFRGHRRGAPLLLAVPTTSTSRTTLPIRRQIKGSRTLTKLTLDSKNESFLVLKNPDDTDTASPERVMRYP